MPPTPRRQGLEPRGDAAFLGDVLALSVRTYRGFNRLSQQDLAERMTALLPGQRWFAQTVGEVERGLRTVSVEEVFALALSLTTSVASLLTPSRLSGMLPPAYDLGGPIPVSSSSVVELLGHHATDEAPYLNLITWRGNTPVAVKEIGS